MQKFDYEQCTRSTYILLMTFSSKLLSNPPFPNCLLPAISNQSLFTPCPPSTNYALSCLITLFSFERWLRSNQIKFRFQMMNQSKISHTQSIWCSSNGNTQTSPATFFFFPVGSCFSATPRIAGVDCGATPHPPICPHHLSGCLRHPELHPSLPGTDQMVKLKFLRPMQRWARRWQRRGSLCSTANSVYKAGSSGCCHQG